METCLVTCFFAVILGALAADPAHAQALPVATPQLDPTGPGLPQNPTTEQRLDFAFQSWKWASEAYPPDSFKSGPTGTITPVEWQLHEALAALDGVEDGPADKANQDYKDHELDTAESLLEDVAKGEAEWSVIKDLLQPAPADDQGPGAFRDAMRAKIADQMDRYAEVAAARDAFEHSIDRNPIPSFPSMTQQYRPWTKSDSEALLRELRGAEEQRARLKARRLGNTTAMNAATARYTQLLPTLNSNLAKANAAAAAEHHGGSGFDPLNDIVTSVVSIFTSGTPVGTSTGVGQDQDRGPGPWIAQPEKQQTPPYAPKPDNQGPIVPHLD